MNEAATPLLELLRRIPEDSRHSYKVQNGFCNIAYGRLCHDSAEEIERLRHTLLRISQYKGWFYSDICGIKHVSSIARNALETKGENDRE